MCSNRLGSSERNKKSSGNDNSGSSRVRRNVLADENPSFWYCPIPNALQQEHSDDRHDDEGDMPSQASLQVEAAGSVHQKQARMEHAASAAVFADNDNEVQRSRDCSSSRLSAVTLATPSKAKSQPEEDDGKTEDPLDEKSAGAESPIDEKDVKLLGFERKIDPEGTCQVGTQRQNGGDDDAEAVVSEQQKRLQEENVKLKGQLTALMSRVTKLATCLVDERSKHTEELTAVENEHQRELSAKSDECAFLQRCLMNEKRERGRLQVRLENKEEQLQHLAAVFHPAVHDSRNPISTFTFNQLGLLRQGDVSGPDRLLDQTSPLSTAERHEYRQLVPSLTSRRRPGRGTPRHDSMRQADASLPFRSLYSSNDEWRFRYHEDGMLHREMRLCQTVVSNLFLRLIESYEREVLQWHRPGQRSHMESASTILQHILKPCAAKAQAMKDRFMAEKRGLVEALVGGTGGGIFGSFWLSAMRHLIRAIRVGEGSFDAGLDIDNELGRCAFVRWATHSDHTVQAPGGMTCSLSSWMEMMFLLELEGVVHDPPLKLWPPVGSRDSFSVRRHRRLVLGNSDETRPEGHPVLILCPGLYWGDPQTHERREPLIPPVVVLFQGD